MRRGALLQGRLCLLLPLLARHLTCGTAFLLGNRLVSEKRVKSTLQQVCLSGKSGSRGLGSGVGESAGGVFGGAGASVGEGKKVGVPHKRPEKASNVNIVGPDYMQVLFSLAGFSSLRENLTNALCMN